MMLVNSWQEMHSFLSKTSLLDNAGLFAFSSLIVILKDFLKTLTISRQYV